MGSGLDRSVTRVADSTETSAPLLSIVIPVYDEERVIQEFHRRLIGVTEAMSTSCEVVYVNDGSADRTLELLKSLNPGRENIRILNLSRNFGKDIALTAGLDFSRGDAVIVIDADLQDPPELIPEMVDCWTQGYDVVYATRSSRRGESWLKKFSAKMFYRTIQHMSGQVKIPEDTGDFRLLSRRAVNAITQLREHHRFMKGLFSWIGFRQKSIFYERDSRFAGKTKWNYWRLWNFSLDGITSFTTVPLRVATYVGLLTAISSFCYGSFIIFRAIVIGDPVPGFPSLMAVITFLGGVQLLTLGIFGEYLGRTFNESKRRPLYFLQDEFEIKKIDRSRRQKDTSSARI
jgi:glycosyltransferase involved in cell wall biosynthesis